MLKAGLIATAIALGAPAGEAQDSPDSLTLGLRLMVAGEPGLAVKAFHRALAEDGPSAEAFTGLSTALYETGRRTQALRIAKSAVDLDPNLAVARNNLGVMLFDSGELSAALTEFERAFALTGGKDKRIAENLGIAELAADRRYEISPKRAQADFDIIQFGHGVFRLEPIDEVAGKPPVEEDPT